MAEESLATLPKRRFPRAMALPVARELCVALKPVSIRLICAGSLRRGAADVGDVELLFIPRFEDRQIDLLDKAPVDLAAERIEQLVRDGVLAKRPSKTGSFSWGELNKLAVHVASGIPVDLFTATEKNWWNYLVCRTGPASSNTRIAAEALRRGWHWHPYGSGFSRTNPETGSLEMRPMESEAAVFAFVGLPALPPDRRGQPAHCLQQPYSAQRT